MSLLYFLQVPGSIDDSVNFNCIIMKIFPDIFNRVIFCRIDPDVIALSGEVLKKRGNPGMQSLLELFFGKALDRFFPGLVSLAECDLIQIQRDASVMFR